MVVEAGTNPSQPNSLVSPPPAVQVWLVMEACHLLLAKVSGLLGYIPVMVLLVA